jgi:hypothetical protein
MEKFRAGKYDVIGLPDAQVLGADSRYKGDVAFIGDASTTLSAAITSGATTISVASNTGFPAVPFRIGIDGEILIVTATSGTTWTVARGADASTAAAHAAGATVSLKMRVDVPACGTGTCTTSTPSRTITGADGKSYRLDTYVTWKPITNSSNVVGRSTKLVTLVVRGTTNTWRTYARVSSAFDLSTGL